jgi:hypothetical protein
MSATEIMRAGLFGDPGSERNVEVWGARFFDLEFWLRLSRGS